MCYINRCSLFEAKITFVVVSFDDAYWIILPLYCWNIPVEADTICLVLPIRNSAANSDTWLGPSTSLVRVDWLIVVLCQEYHLLVHVKWHHTDRPVCEMVYFSFIGSINKSSNFPWLNMTGCHRVVIK